MTLLDALSLEAPVSEEPFLRRELGLSWRQVDGHALATRLTHEHPTVLICSEPAEYVRVLDHAPAQSVVLVLISDEGYDPERRRLVQFHPAVRAVYRQYAARPTSAWTLLRAVAGDVRDARKTSESGRTALPNTLAGRQTRRRMADWLQVTTPVRDVPLGYTSTFEAAFAAVNGVDDVEASLFEDLDGTVGDDTDARPTSITFRGNRGLAQRIMGMELAQRVPGSDVGTIDADWSGFAEGDVGRTYVEALLRSRFALCPPGFVNNESFRYYEALLCGALPIELRTALTHQGVATARAGQAIRRHSWTSGLGEAAGMAEPERRARVTAARTLVRDRLRTLRQQIRDDVEA